MAFCTHCGGQVADDSAFCTRCGQAIATSSPLPPTPSPEMSGAPSQVGSNVPQPIYGSSRAPTPFTNAVFVDPLTGRPLSEWWKRLVAYLIDAVILAVVTVIVFVVLDAATSRTTCTTGFFGETICTNAPPSGIRALEWILVLAFSAAYAVLLIGSSKGQTVGMMALGIAVRDEREDRSIGWGRALLRWFLMFVFSLPFGLALLVDCLSPLWDRRRQAWHDHAAGSIVVDVR